MPSSSFLRLFAFRAALVAIVAAVAACSHGGPEVGPSKLAIRPSAYNGQDVTVTGTAKDPTTRKMRRGTATVYQLCDKMCINVVQFGDTNVSDGDQTTVSGRFHASFGRHRMLANVLVVGGRTGHTGGGEAASPSP